MKNQMNSKWNGRKQRKIFWETEGDTILKENYQALGPLTISKQMGISYKAVRWRASVLGLKVLSKGGCRSQHNIKYGDKVNHYYFSKPIDESMAYVLGYLWTDGSNGLSRSGKYANVALYCHIQDEDILLSVRKELESSHKLVYRGQETKFDKLKEFNKSPSVRCVICSPKLSEDLHLLHGIAPRKSFLDLPSPNIPNEFFGDFLRGCFDGDGCATKHGFNLCGTPKFIKETQDRLVLQYGLKRNVIYSHTPCNLSITWEAKKDVEILWDLMYGKNPRLKGKRKFEKFTNILQSKAQMSL